MPDNPVFNLRTMPCKSIRYMLKQLCKNVLHILNTKISTLFHHYIK